MFNLFKLVKTIIVPFILVFGIVCIISSSGGGGNSSDTQSSVLDCSGPEPDARCAEDRDNDGLSYATETQGWKVLADRYGYGLGKDAFGQLDEDYAVTSDPNKADTDGDGLDDNQEYLIKSDPHMVDTDQDGLTDEEELNRWGSSPLSIDSDGDARGDNEDRAPNPALFDSAELKIDLANDPSHTPGPGATSPLFADTDGDSLSDYYERIEALGEGFNPVISDTPKISIEIAKTPIIGFFRKIGETTEWTRNVSVTDTLSNSVSKEISHSESTELVVGNTSGFGMTHGWEGGVEGWKFVGNINGSYSLNWGTSSATTNVESVSWSSEQTKTAETAYQEELGEGGSLANETTGGYISVHVNIHNKGVIAYKLSGLRINVMARYIGGDRDYKPVMELTWAANSITIAPGNSLKDILLKGESEDPTLIASLRDLLKNPSGLLFKVASYELKDIDDNSFAFSEETIKQKSAYIVIDYGLEASSEQYMVATTPSRVPGESSGITMATVLNDILDMSYETSTVTDENGTFQALSSLNGFANDANTHKKWLLITSGDIAKDETPLDFDDILLKAGDYIKLIFVKDEDSDGLSGREEFLSGTSDKFADTDGDGLTDYEEVREGWTVTLENQLGYDVKSRGYREDSDDDNITDDIEKICGLDPNRADSDQDGINDLVEIEGYDITKDGILTTHVYPYQGQVILDGGNGIAETNTSGDDVAVRTGSIDKGSIIITAGQDGVIDSIVGGDDYLGTEHKALPCALGAEFATNPLNPDTDGDSMSDGLVEKALGLGSPNNPNDISAYLDSDGDGLSDASEIAGFGASVNGSATYHFNSDPDNPDSDDDGLPDLLEYLLKSNPESDDTDNDKLSDYDEYDFTQTPERNDFETRCDQLPSTDACQWPATSGENYGTEINHWDSDGDELSDYDEINGWDVFVDGAFKKSVTAKEKDGTDRDHDGLNDLDEYINKTDPEKYDTDGDGKNDGDELSMCAKPMGYQTTKCRSPIQGDRKVTVTYSYVNYVSDCEKILGFIPDPDEVQWELYIKYPYSETSNPPKWFLMEIDSNNNADGRWWYVNKRTSFISNIGDTFKLMGYIIELDGAAVDQYLLFGPVGCHDCSLEDRRFSYQDFARNDAEPTYTVGDPETSLMDIQTTPGSKCGLLDNGTGTRIFNFNANVTGEIIVE